MTNHTFRNFLITGAGGFLGKNILEKSSEYDRFFALGRKEPKNVHNFQLCDLKNSVPQLIDVDYDAVFHVAGKAHIVPKTKEESEDFFHINLTGTKYLLDAIDKLVTRPKRFVFISTVAVYGLNEGNQISESHPTQPTTPYGKSKLQAEELVQSWCEKKNIEYLILRLPLIAGSSPPGNLGSMKKAISTGKYPRITNNHAKKSMVLAPDVAQLMLNFEGRSGIYNLTDGTHPSFNQIESAIEKRVSKKIKLNIPIFALKPFAFLGDIAESIFKKSLPLSSLRLKKLTATITFDDSKARRELNWNPNPVLPFLETNL